MTDPASIPQPRWSLLPPNDQYNRAAIVHDYLYWSHALQQRAGRQPLLDRDEGKRGDQRSARNEQYYHRGAERLAKQDD
ncbi:DUF1353 domain-containing protein [Variovorax robiniae]|uniref:DUF1353 domain-containing protein n=1 Tax=Variovorax robiniae TaxID=1836199 RepID=UPI003BF51510